MNGNDMIDHRDDNVSDYQWWYQTTGQYQDEQKHAQEFDDANALLRMIAGDDE